jgi:hypothetical protein
MFWTWIRIRFRSELNAYAYVRNPLLLMLNHLRNYQCCSPHWFQIRILEFSTQYRMDPNPGKPNKSEFVRIRNLGRFFRQKKLNLHEKYTLRRVIKNA